MGDGGRDDDQDPGVMIVGVVLLAVLFLAFLRFCDFCCKRRGKKEEDTEHLDPSIEINGCWNSFFTCCSEISEENSNQGQKVEEQGQAEAPRENGGVSPLHLPVTAPPTAAVVEGAEEQEDEQQQVVPRSKKGMDFNSITLALKYLQHQQKVEQENGAAKLTRIRLVQNLLQLEKGWPTEESLNAALVIGVDATPKVVAGYCVNLREMRVEWYVIKMEDFPWSMENINDPVEFEMKNLIFALAVWNKSIMKLKRFRVYTDNNGICGGSSSEFGKDAGELLKHLTGCQGAVLGNEGEVWVNRIQDLAGFAKYIQPADDLSRWQVEKAVDFLCKFYGIHSNRAKGTLKLTVSFTKKHLKK